MDLSHQPAVGDTPYRVLSKGGVLVGRRLVGAVERVSEYEWWPLAENGRDRITEFSCPTQADAADLVYEAYVSAGTADATEAN